MLVVVVDVLLAAGANSLGLLIVVEDDECMEVAITDVSNDRGSQLGLSEILLGLVYQLG